MGPALEEAVGSHIVSKGMTGSWTFFRYVGGEVIGSQHHQPSGSNLSVGYVLVGSIWLTSTEMSSTIYKTAQRT